MDIVTEWTLDIPADAADDAALAAALDALAGADDDDAPLAHVDVQACYWPANTPTDGEVAA